MRDDDCIHFLQWALPQMRMRWPGFRRVRGQVCKRIQQRMGTLALTDITAYQAYLHTHPGEWKHLAYLCRVTISRFYRDRPVFERLERELLPELAALAQQRGEKAIRCLSIGCACGEEPYSVVLLWFFGLCGRYPDLGFEMVGIDTDAVLLQRAQIGCYPPSSVRALPPRWREVAFHRHDDGYCLQFTFRQRVQFALQDVCDALPSGPFHLVLCRNLVFTYFDLDLQREILNRIDAAVVEGSLLVLGMHEVLPDGAEGFVCPHPHLPVYVRAR